MQATVCYGKATSSPRNGPNASVQATGGLIPRRRFGQSSVELSALCFGCMRLSPSRFNLKEAVDLLLALFDRGVTSFHSSHEYDTYAFFCTALKELRRLRPGRKIETIVKIGVPHFDETEFSPARFRSLIEAELRNLRVDRVDIVQWLVRHTPNEDAPRLDILRRASSSIHEVWRRLHAEGKVGLLTAFPYSDTFLRASLELPDVAGLVTYLNLIETEAIPYLDGLFASGRGFAAIRPLNAGMLVGGTVETVSALRDIFPEIEASPDALTLVAFQFPLWHPAVAAVIASISSLGHAEQAIDAIAETVPDIERFRRIAGIRQGADDAAA
jgi:aryl-alcohol dehydrogenase-like predicted oxidoreductase